MHYSSGMRLRFAPSPTGHLHVGNARTALFNWLLARGSGATYILRIEDTDRERSSPASEAAILEDLRWLGLGWDEGPDVGGRFGPYRQSERTAVYHEHAQRLLAAGRAYCCFCTPEQLETDRAQALARGDRPGYLGRCRGLSADEVRQRRAAGMPAAIRFAIPPGPDVTFEDRVRGPVTFSRDVMGDPIIVRSDGQPAYNFAVVVDDALMRVTHVVRGEDHISNTPRQALIYDALGYPQPVFAHLSLVLGPDHTPLSKRHGATSVAEFRARGFLPEALVNYLALIGWSPGGNQEILPLPELAKRFALEQVGRTAGVFDLDKLSWINRHYLREAEPDRLAGLILPRLTAAHTGEPDGRARSYVAASVVPLIAGAVNRLDDAPARVAFLFDDVTEAALDRPGVREELVRAEIRGVVRSLAEVLEGTDRLIDRERFRAATARVREQTGQKGRALFHTVRIVLTGQADGPELDLAVPAIDRGAELPAGTGLPAIRGCRERARAFARRLADTR
jgi:glutamyl-tRNA synthetase